MPRTLSATIQLVWQDFLGKEEDLEKKCGKLLHA